MQPGVTGPLMPKGVEHVAAILAYGASMAVTGPLMPKGVEHLFCTSQLAARDARDGTSDAERR